MAREGADRNRATMAASKSFFENTFGQVQSEEEFRSWKISLKDMEKPGSKSSASLPVLELFDDDLKQGQSA
ncbi:MAG: hypothetical protein K2X27_19495 [Candidatus Obscuribacterales bacterium]|nr:hypothetical protein [Candidatus Obscuribacterales bacterium]